MSLYDVGDIIYDELDETDRLVCDGSQVSIEAYGELHLVIGNKFGAADPGYVRLPDVPVNPYLQSTKVLIQAKKPK